MCARMIPPEIGYYERSSHENEIFEVLKEKLDDNYIVLHSFKTDEKIFNSKFESENDFVIFHPSKGILVLEVKHGGIVTREREWYQICYDNNTHEQFEKSIDPYGQASRGAHRIYNKIRELRNSGRKLSCKCISAVWFMSIDKQDIDRIEDWPSEAGAYNTLSKDDLSNPKKKIDEIFTIKPEGLDIVTNLSIDEKNLILNRILCPEFNLVPKVSSWEQETRNYEFAHLLKEQAMVLDFIEEQKTVAVNGSAGTGKTLIAVEKAKRMADQNEKVLFLCYNRKLKDYLEKCHEYKNVKYMTIKGLITYLANGDANNYTGAINELAEIYAGDSTKQFDYNSIIIDEGQDLGALEINGDNYGTQLLSWLYNIVDDVLDGSFYIFYDEFQLINGATNLPDFIQKAECKITLHKNCRNTTDIAKASVHPMIYSYLRDSSLSKPDRRKLQKRRNNIKGVSNGTIPTIKYSVSSDKRKIIDDTISQYIRKGYSENNIVVLTCMPENRTAYKQELESGKYVTKNGKTVEFSNCNKFKGMEAECIILIEVTPATFTDIKNTRAYYVGLSRAKQALTIVAQCSESDCENLVEKYFGEDHIENTYQEDLANILCCQKQ